MTHLLLQLQLRWTQIGDNKITGMIDTRAFDAAGDVQDHKIRIRQLVIRFIDWSQLIAHWVQSVARDHALNICPVEFFAPSDSVVQPPRSHKDYANYQCYAARKRYTVR